MTTWVRGECFGERPQAIEVTPTCVFVRKSFTAIAREEEGARVEGWEYQETKMSHGEYAAYAAQEAQEQGAMLEEAICELAELIGGE